jgi:hypothetical protein
VAGELHHCFAPVAPHDRTGRVSGDLLTVANKIFDIFPELLIGAAIDVVVNLTTVHRRPDRRREPLGQLVALAVVNAGCGGRVGHRVAT